MTESRPRRYVFVVERATGGGAEHVVSLIGGVLAQDPTVRVEILALLDPPGATTTEDGVLIRGLGAPRVRRAVPALVRDLRADPPSAVVSTLKHVSLSLGLAHRLIRPVRHVARVANTYSSELAAMPLPRPRGLSGAPASQPSTDRRVRRRLERCGHGSELDVGDRPVEVPHDSQPRRRRPRYDIGRRAAAVGSARGAGEVSLRGSARPAEAPRSRPSQLRSDRRPPRRPARHRGRWAVAERPRATRAHQLGIGSRVVFTGRLENPYPLFRASTALVLSSRFEGMPNVLLEAQALGLWPISTDCPHGPAEIITDDRLGELVSTDDVAHLAEAMGRARVDAARRGVPR